jgi:hypothetical protein
MNRPLIALLTTQTYIVALVFTDSGHLRTTLVVTPSSRGEKSPVGSISVAFEARANQGGRR